jgi:hypothetical protein
VKQGRAAESGIAARRLTRFIAAKLFHEEKDYNFSSGIWLGLNLS